MSYLRVGRWAGTPRWIVLVGVVFALAAAILPLPASASGYQRPGTNELISVRGVVGPLEQPGSSVDASISADGRFVAFTGYLAVRSDIFVRDRREASTEVVSRDPFGLPGVSPTGGDSYEPAISGNGRYVAFASDAVNLVPGDTNLMVDVFVHDRKTGSTELLSVASDGTQGDRQSMLSAVSANGRYVAFDSSATNLVEDDTNGAGDVFVRDRKTGRTERVSVASGGAQGAAQSFGGAAVPSISATGQFVAFSSSYSNRVADDTNGLSDIFVHDRKTRRTERVSVASGGRQAALGASFGNFQFGQNISADGRYVTFESLSQDLVPNDSLRVNCGCGFDNHDVFLHDRKLKRTRRVSVSSSGGEFGREYIGRSNSISGNGRYTSFTKTRFAAEARLRGPEELNFLHDALTGATEAITVGWDGSDATFALVFCDGGSSVPGSSPSDTGRFVAFASCATNVVPEDADGHDDVFLRDRGPDLGVGGLEPPDRNPPGDPQPRVCIPIAGICPDLVQSVSAPDADDDAPAVAGEQGGELIGARLAHRPYGDDLFVRVEVEGMPSVLGTPPVAPALLYGLDFTVAGLRYQVRVQRVAGPDFDSAGGASFGLFRRDSNTGTWIRVAGLRGGYGTTGHEVVFALPLRHVDLGKDGKLTDVVAFSSLGTYDLGPVTIVDRARVSR